MDLEAVLEEAGFSVLPPVKDVKGALKTLADERPDVATLDMNLNGETSAPVATKLMEEGIPFIVLSGYDPTFADNAVFAGVPLVRKPFDTRSLVEALHNALEATTEHGAK